ncbi:Leucine rich repeat containing protein 6 [Trichuris trichiura]|uniref:Cysteine protease n=1 Tax=Trichuris trichiura TaxID=36087 RepID=A0A077Z811_TRITR|nr:Leucine rich repeat containing protein 6 [Trichuris trichiura]
MGRQYCRKEALANRRDQYEEAAFSGNMDDFLVDFSSRIWLSYRFGFERIAGTHMTSDCGWGCTLRSGQMLLAETLMRHYLNEDRWRPLTNCESAEQHEEKLYRSIVAEFADCKEAAFSIHKLVELSRRLFDKKPGSRHGPASTSLLLQAAVEESNIPSLPNTLAVYVVRDGVLLIDELEVLGYGMNRKQSSSMGQLHQKAKMSSVEQLIIGRQRRCTDPAIGRSKSEMNLRLDDLPGLSHVFDESLSWVKSVLVLVSLHLGGERFNSVYIDHLKKVLSMKFCVGIIGGRASRAMYYVGWHRDYLICMDPHYSQRALRKNATSFPSCHCKWPKKLLFGKMDPNCTIGFYVRNRHELQEFLAEASEVSAYGCLSPKYPLFTILSSAEDKRKLQRSPFRSATALAKSGSSLSISQMHGSREFVFV